MEDKRYLIADRTFVQRPLVLGQFPQMVEVLKGVMIPADGSPMSIAVAMADKLPEAMAVVLTPEGQPVKDKDLAELAGFFADNMELPTACEVIEDFFGLTQVPLIGQRLQRLGVKTPQGIAANG